jgi:hypothetical protein
MSIKRSKEATKKEMPEGSTYAKRWRKTNIVHKTLFSPPCMTRNQTESVVNLVLCVPEELASMI